MASGGVGSAVVYLGTVEHVVKGYGFITLDSGYPVPRAFFDRSSVGMAVDDLTERFQKGCQIKARIGLTDGEHKVKFKALGLMLENQDDSSIRGGDNYLKNYLEVHGAVELQQLVYHLSVAKDNCPRFLKKGDVTDIKKVVAFRPDWFEIRNGFLCLTTDKEEPQDYDTFELEKSLHHDLNTVYDSSVMLSNQDDSSTRGGDNYLKKYLEVHGAVELQQLVYDLSVGKDNCPRFLKNGDVNDINKVVVFRPDWFEINDGYLCLKTDKEELMIGVDESSVRGGDNFLKNYLENHGALELEKLVEDLKVVQSNCPKFLRKGDVNEIRKVVAFRPDLFEIKNGLLCLTAVEKELVDEFLQNLPMQDNAIKFESINGIIRPDHKHCQYLYTSGQWDDGVKDFVGRNAGVLVFWNEAIYTLSFVLSRPWLEKKFRADLMAVKYYSQFVNAKGPLAIKSLSGHFNQASDTVKEAARTKESEFREFLERNSMFFVLQGDIVMECPAHRLAIIDQFWLKKKTNPLPSSSGLPPKPKPCSTSNPTNEASPSQSPDWSSSQPKTPVQVSKAFSDLEGETMAGKPARNHHFESSFIADGVNLETSTQAIPSLMQIQAFGPSSCGDIFSLPDAQTFKKLIGNPIARALEDEILSNDTLNSLLLLRLNIGKPPMAKFRIPGEASGYNHTLKINPAKIEDLQRILRHKEVVKMDRPSHYGVKGTLHSIRTLEQGGKMTTLTIFCQLHEVNDGLGLDIWEGKKLTAIFTGNYPVKYIYNYLRGKCERLSKRGDVLVVDVDGQLSGCDEHSHSSVGNVTRVLCSSSSELTRAITNSIQHMHEYAAIIGIDDEEHLKAVQKMCSKGTQVIAEISSDLKQEVTKLFM